MIIEVESNSSAGGYVAEHKIIAYNWEDIACPSYPEYEDFLPGIGLTRSEALIDFIEKNKVRLDGATDKVHYLFD